MSTSDRERWEARYGREGLVMGERVKPLVRELEPVLPWSGRALDIACGEGQLAVWLAQRGLDVTAVDISPSGLAKLRAQAEAAGVGVRVHGIEADLDHGLPALEPGFDLVTCIDFYSPAVMAQARHLLAPGGMLLVQVVLERTGAEARCKAQRFGADEPAAGDSPPPGDSPHRARSNEALEFAAGMRLQFWREGNIDGRALAQLLAQREPAGRLPFSA
ncbi:bifunctional 2-polyprenyl-6-hydroxyphenol methylase/3-demethylubiquinol 3-O-methyltransferase UbiG [Thioalkalivibrio sp. XN279]|uniref:class I SAM-dependent methyltransferase n=1 Tax=Thioalkalivibrio sp. XN279 TaxID=2714953 RepID=UPI00140D1F90|nr:class I SAM-dependent methyltransferase [Thioalkalivibrio sp. XN279]NHA15926.1 class I SAM-dependent methyltransferase [Thioalkalivibrio sp. XN279]